MAPADLSIVLERIQAQAKIEHVRLTLHAHAEMVDEAISFDDVLEVISPEQSRILENYPEHRRGACCLLGGTTKAGRWVHVVCTTEQPALIIITVYAPKPPKWVTPTQRGER